MPCSHRSSPVLRGSAGPPLALIGVGGEFISNGWPSPLLLGRGPLAGTVLGRLVVLPCLALLLWGFAYPRVMAGTMAGTGPLAQDRVLRLVLCIEVRAGGGRTAGRRGPGRRREDRGASRSGPEEGGPRGVEVRASRGSGPAAGPGRGSTGRGSTGRGAPKEGSTGRGSTGRGSTGRGSTGRGSTGRGSTGRGSTRGAGGGKHGPLGGRGGGTRTRAARTEARVGVSLVEAGGPKKGH